MAIFRASADSTGILYLLTDFALLRRAEGDELAYWRLGGAIERLREETGANSLQNPISVIEWHAPGEPPTAEARTAWAAGQRLPIEDAVAEAAQTASTTSEP
jgi:hypothetical protein